MSKAPSRCDPGWRNCKAGSLAGAAHLLNDNTGVQSVSQEGQKPSVADKAKWHIYPIFQY